LRYVAVTFTVAFYHARLTFTRFTAALRYVPHGLVTFGYTCRLRLRGLRWFARFTFYRTFTFPVTLHLPVCGWLRLPHPGWFHVYRFPFTFTLVTGWFGYHTHGYAHARVARTHTRSRLLLHVYALRYTLHGLVTRRVCGYAFGLLVCHGLCGWFAVYGLRLLHVTVYVLVTLHVYTRLFYVWLRYGYGYTPRWFTPRLVWLRWFTFALQLHALRLCCYVTFCVALRLHYVTTRLLFTFGCVVWLLVCLRLFVLHLHARLRFGCLRSLHTVVVLPPHGCYAPGCGYTTHVYYVPVVRWLRLRLRGCTLRTRYVYTVARLLHGYVYVHAVYHVYGSRTRYVVHTYVYVCYTVTHVYVTPFTRYTFVLPLYVDLVTVTFTLVVTVGWFVTVTFGYVPHVYGWFTLFLRLRCLFTVCLIYVCGYVVYGLLRLHVCRTFCVHAHTFVTFTVSFGYVYVRYRTRFTFVYTFRFTLRGCTVPPVLLLHVRLPHTHTFCGYAAFTFAFVARLRIATRLHVAVTAFVGCYAHTHGCGYCYGYVPLPRGYYTTHVTRCVGWLRFGYTVVAVWFGSTTFTVWFAVTFTVLRSLLVRFTLHTFTHTTTHVYAHAHVYRTTTRAVTHTYGYVWITAVGLCLHRLRTPLCGYRYHTRLRYVRSRFTHARAHTRLRATLRLRTRVYVAVGSRTPRLVWLRLVHIHRLPFTVLPLVLPHHGYTTCLHTRLRVGYGYTRLRYTRSRFVGYGCYVYTRFAGYTHLRWLRFAFTVLRTRLVPGCVARLLVTRFTHGALHVYRLVLPLPVVYGWLLQLQFAPRFTYVTVGYLRYTHTTVGCLRSGYVVTVTPFTRYTFTLPRLRFALHTRWLHTHTVRLFTHTRLRLPRFRALRYYVYVYHGCCSTRLLRFALLRLRTFTRYTRLLRLVAVTFWLRWLRLVTTRLVYVYGFTFALVYVALPRTPLRCLPTYVLPVGYPGLVTRVFTHGYTRSTAFTFTHGCGYYVHRLGCALLRVTLRYYGCCLRCGYVTVTHGYTFVYTPAFAVYGSHVTQLVTVPVYTLLLRLRYTRFCVLPHVYRFGWFVTTVGWLRLVCGYTFTRLVGYGYTVTALLRLLVGLRAFRLRLVPFTHVVTHVYVTHRFGLPFAHWFTVAVGYTCTVTVGYTRTRWLFRWLHTFVLRCHTVAAHVVWLRYHTTVYVLLGYTHVWLRYRLRCRWLRLRLVYIYVWFTFGCVLRLFVPAVVLGYRLHTPHVGLRTTFCTVAVYRLRGWFTRLRHVTLLRFAAFTRFHVRYVRSLLRLFTFYVFVCTVTVGYTRWFHVYVCYLRYVTRLLGYRFTPLPFTPFVAVLRLDCRSRLRYALPRYVVVAVYPHRTHTRTHTHAAFTRFALHTFTRLHGCGYVSLVSVCLHVVPVCHYVCLRLVSLRYVCWFTGSLPLRYVRCTHTLRFTLPGYISHGLFPTRLRLRLRLRVRLRLRLRYPHRSHYTFITTRYLRLHATRLVRLVTFVFTGCYVPRLRDTFTLRSLPRFTRLPTFTTFVTFTHGFICYVPHTRYLVTVCTHVYTVGYVTVTRGWLLPRLRRLPHTVTFAVGLHVWFYTFTLRFTFTFTRLLRSPVWLDVLFTFDFTVYTRVWLRCYRLLFFHLFGLRYVDLPFTFTFTLFCVYVHVYVTRGYTFTFRLILRFTFTPFTRCTPRSVIYRTFSHTTHVCWLRCCFTVAGLHTHGCLHHGLPHVYARSTVTFTRLRLHHTTLPLRSLDTRSFTRYRCTFYVCRLVTVCSLRLHRTHTRGLRWLPFTHAFTFAVTRTVTRVLRLHACRFGCWLFTTVLRLRYTHGYPVTVGLVLVVTHLRFGCVGYVVVVLRLHVTVAVTVVIYVYHGYVYTYHTVVYARMRSHVARTVTVYVYRLRLRLPFTLRYHHAPLHRLRYAFTVTRILHVHVVTPRYVVYVTHGYRFYRLRLRLLRLVARVYTGCGCYVLRLLRYVVVTTVDFTLFRLRLVVTVYVYVTLHVCWLRTVCRCYTFVTFTVVTILRLVVTLLLHTFTRLVTTRSRLRCRWFHRLFTGCYVAVYVYGLHTRYGYVHYVYGYVTVPHVVGCYVWTHVVTVLRYVCILPLRLLLRLRCVTRSVVPHVALFGLLFCRYRTPRTRYHTVALRGLVLVCSCLRVTRLVGYGYHITTFCYVYVLRLPPFTGLVRSHGSVRLFHTTTRYHVYTRCAVYAVTTGCCRAPLRCLRLPFTVVTDTRCLPVGYRVHTFTVGYRLLHGYGYVCLPLRTFYGLRFTAFVTAVGCCTFCGLRLPACGLHTHTLVAFTVRLRFTGCLPHARVLRFTRLRLVTAHTVTRLRFAVYAVVYARSTLVLYGWVARTFTLPFRLRCLPVTHVWFYTFVGWLPHVYRLHVTSRLFTLPFRFVTRTFTTPVVHRTTLRLLHVVHHVALPVTVTVYVLRVVGLRSRLPRYAHCGYAHHTTFVTTVHRSFTVYVTFGYTRLLRTVYAHGYTLLHCSCYRLFGLPVLAVTLRVHTRSFTVYVTRSGSLLRFDLRVALVAHVWFYTRYCCHTRLRCTFYHTTVTVTVGRLPRFTLRYVVVTTLRLGYLHVSTHLRCRLVRLPTRLLPHVPLPHTHHHTRLRTLRLRLVVVWLLHTHITVTHRLVVDVYTRLRCTVYTRLRCSYRVWVAFTFTFDVVRFTTVDCYVPFVVYTHVVWLRFVVGLHTHTFTVYVGLRLRLRSFVTRYGYVCTLR